MEYLIHYSDGSEGYLSHHGVKGMKWDVWNDETRARYMKSGKSFAGGGGTLEDDEETEEDKIAKIESDEHKEKAYNKLKEGDAYGALLESVKAVENKNHGPYANSLHPELDTASVFAETSVRVLSETEQARKAKQNIDTMINRRKDMEKADTLSEAQKDELRAKRDASIKEKKKAKKKKRDEAIKNGDVLGILNNL